MRARAGSECAGARRLRHAGRARGAAL